MIATAKILVIDDEPHIRRLLHTTLVRAAYEVSEAENAAQALAMLPGLDPDVVLLDLGLPDRDGLELVPLIKKQSSATLLVVSAREETGEKVASLDLGADDYVTKPFDTEELLARVRAALRHRLDAQGARSSVMAGHIEIDLLNHRVARDDTDVHLTPKEFAVIAELAKFPGRVITHAHLLRHVWANEDQGQIEYLRVVIRNLRQKIEVDPSKPQIVVNELGVGYRLLGVEAPAGP